MWCLRLDHEVSRRVECGYAPHSPSDDAPWTIGRLVTWTAGHLTRAGVADARLGTELLLAKALGCRRIDLYTRFEQVPEAATLDAFRAFVKRAALREPIAYIIGEREFFSLPFRVTRDVLIPRPETETLVERVLDHCKTRAIAAPRLTLLRRPVGRYAYGFASRSYPHCAA